MLKRILMLDDSQIVLDVVKEALSYGQFDVNITTSSVNFIEIDKEIQARPFNSRL